MWIASVYLIGPAAGHEELTYWSAREHQTGEIVRVPYRSKQSFGLVSKCEPASAARQTIRGAGFSLKKIAGSGKKILSRQFLRAAFEIAQRAGSSPGAVLDALIPAAILERFESLPEAQETSRTESAARNLKASPEVNFIVAHRDERIVSYRTAVEAARKCGRSAIIAAPTIVEAERIAAELPDSILLHGGMAKKSLRESWERIAAAKKPVAVAGTALALAVPRADVGLVALERALARGWDPAARPFIDRAACAERLAEAHQATLMIGSALLPLQAKGAAAPLIARSRGNISLIDMRPAHKAGPEELAARPKFEVFSRAARERIGAALERGENVLVLAARRGLAPHTSCDDCGTPLSCPRCGAGLVLYEKQHAVSLVEGGRRRWFECPYCALTERANVLCPACGSWRLSMTGVGLTLAAKELARLFPDAGHTIADERALQTPKKTRSLAQTFEGSRGGILAATEGMLPYLGSIVPLAVVASIDSMLFIPEYSASERALSLLAELGARAHDILLQTRAPEHPAIEAFVADRTKAYRARELELREKFRYPPFFTLIRLSVSGTPERVRAQTEAAARALERFRPQRFPGRSRTGGAREHILIRLPARDWVDPALLAFLRALPLSIEVRVDPKQVLSD